MYQPENAERPQYPMFPKVNGRVLSFLSGAGVAAVALTAALGIALFSLTGLIVRETQVPLSQAERAEEVGMLTAARDLLVLDQAEAALAEIDQDSSGQASPERQQLAERRQAAALSLASVDEADYPLLLAEAERRGISAETTDEEIEAMAASTKTAVEPYLGDFERGVALIAAPAALALMLFVEPAGCPSLASVLMDARAFSRRRRELFFERSVQ